MVDLLIQKQYCDLIFGYNFKIINNSLQRWLGIGITPIPTANNQHLLNYNKLLHPCQCHPELGVCSV
jgi:hypothetical protein